MAVEREIGVSEGWDIYWAIHQKILDTLKEADKAKLKQKLVIIDLNSGDYEIVDGDDKAALARLLARRPDAQAWPQWAGREIVWSMGWSGTYPNFMDNPEIISIFKDFAKEHPEINPRPSND